VYQSDPATATIASGRSNCAVDLEDPRPPFFEGLSDVKLARDIDGRHGKLFLASLKRRT